MSQSKFLAMLFNNIQPFFIYYLPRNILILMYNSFVLSKLNYCPGVLGNSADTHLNNLLLLKKKILCIIYQTHYLAPSQPLFEK